jgi:hypothetical protein
MLSGGGGICDGSGDGGDGTPGGGTGGGNGDGGDGTPGDGEDDPFARAEELDVVFDELDDVGAVSDDDGGGGGCISEDDDEPLASTCTCMLSHADDEETEPRKGTG